MGENDIKEKIIEIAGKIDHKTLAVWAIDCAEHVLSFFEEKYPKDDRPRNAIEVGRAWVRDEISVGEARSAAHAVATAHVAGHAVYAANYAAKAIAKELLWQYKHLLDLVKKNNYNE